MSTAESGRCDRELVLAFWAERSDAAEEEREMLIVSVRRPLGACRRRTKRRRVLWRVGGLVLVEGVSCMLWALLRRSGLWGGVGGGVEGSR